ncbi:MAG: tryptophan synthase subunit alpha, partial [Solirubrobacteraceae bacterium]
MMSKPARDRVPALAQTGCDRIAAGFALARGRAAFMPYVMGGFPDLQTSLRIGEACAANGADLLELAVPYSDPLADGPAIHAAGTTALRGGATLETVLAIGETLARRVPIVLMCYVNIVLARGPQAFAERLREAGISGLVVADLPQHEAGELRDA